MLGADKEELTFKLSALTVVAVRVPLMIAVSPLKTPPLKIPAS